MLREIKIKLFFCNSQKKANFNTYLFDTKETYFIQAVFDMAGKILNCYCNAWKYGCALQGSKVCSIH